jgi:hypothetical protein
VESGKIAFEVRGDCGSAGDLAKQAASCAASAIAFHFVQLPQRGSVWLRMFFLLRLEKFLVFTGASLLLVWSGVLVYGHDLGSEGDQADGDGAVRSLG